MRWTITAACLCVVIFFIAEMGNPKGLITSAGSCRESCSQKYIDAPFTSVFDVLLNSAGTTNTTVSVLEKKPLLYFAANDDTVRLSGISREGIASLQHIDLSVSFPTLKVFNAASIPAQFAQQWQANLRVLMEVQDEDLHYVGAAAIVEAQLDDDPELERIVQVEQGWFHTYLFYNRQESGWLLAGQVSMPNNGALETPDLSLPGFAGLTTYAHGTGMGVLDNTYYTLQAGQLTECFTINKSVRSYLCGLISGPAFVLETQATPLLVNASEIFVEHTIRCNKETPQSPAVEMAFEETIAYSLLRQPDGRFLPDKPLNGFNALCIDSTCDSTYFFPEAYAYERLRVLKDRGNARQRKLLKDFEYSSTTEFR